jgi:hypothetical protein
MTDRKSASPVQPRTLRQPLPVTQLTTARGQRRHDRATLGMREARPRRDFIERAIATDTYARVGINRADFCAGGFDGLECYSHVGIISVSALQPRID